MLCEWKKCEVQEMSVQIDHIHVVMTIPPKVSVSQMMGILKGKLAKMLFNGFKLISQYNDKKTTFFSKQEGVHKTFLRGSCGNGSSTNFIRFLFKQWHAIASAWKNWSEYFRAYGWRVSHITEWYK